MKKQIIVLAIGIFLIIVTGVQRCNNAYALEKNPNQFKDQAGIHYFTKNVNNL